MHLVFHGVLADFLPVSFIKRVPSRPAVPMLCVRRRARTDGNCVKAPSYLANCASRNQLQCIKRVGAYNCALHTQLALCWGAEIHARSLGAPASAQSKDNNHNYINRGLQTKGKHETICFLLPLFLSLMLLKSGFLF